MSKMKQFLRVNYKYAITFILGVLIASTTTYAIAVAGNVVTYDNTSSGLTSTNVQSAIDELYAKSNTLKATVGLYRNSNIVKVMKYDQTENSETLCITGNEATCEELAPTTSTTYEMGTIVDYRVNPSTVRRFYVLHDDGTTLTLQDQKNIVERIEYAIKADFIADGGTESEWNSCTDPNNNVVGCSTRGPVTILPDVEEATSTWTNVNLQTYTPGTTSFAGNSSTECTYMECLTNGYTMRERAGRARIITVPEAWRAGCQTWSIGTCPKYMYNYLKEANNNNGIIDGTEDSWGYWTMNTRPDEYTYAWHVYCTNQINGNSVNYSGAGGRAVVEINK